MPEPVDAEIDARLAALERPRPGTELAQATGRLAAFFECHGRVATIVGASPAARVALVNSALHSLHGPVHRAGNPLNSPLSLSRLLLQVGVWTQGADAGRALYQGLAAHAPGSPPAVLWIDDAHTLDPGVLTVLAELPMLGNPGQPGLLLVLSGGAGLLGLRAAPGLEPLRNPETTLTLELAGEASEPERLHAAPRSPATPAVPLPRPPYRAPIRNLDDYVAPTGPETGAEMVEPMRPVTPAPAAAAPERTPLSSQPPARKKVVWPVLVTVALLLAGGGGALAWRLTHTADIVPAGSPPVTVAIPAPPLPTPAPPTQSPPPVQTGNEIKPSSGAKSEAEMLQEFDAFLRRTGREAIARSPEARETLFREFLDWQARPRPAAVQRPAPPG